MEQPVVPSRACRRRREGACVRACVRRVFAAGVEPAVGHCETGASATAATATRARARGDRCDVSTPFETIQQPMRRRAEESRDVDATGHGCRHGTYGGRTRTTLSSQFENCLSLCGTLPPAHKFPQTDKNSPVENPLVPWTSRTVLGPSCGGVHSSWSVPASRTS